MSSAATEIGTLSPSEGWTVAVTATLVMAVSYVDRQTLAVIAPTVREALQINHAEFGWLTGAFSLSYLVFAPISGALIDRVGCRVGLVLAVIAWSVVSGMHALAASFWTLFALRIALGVTEAPSFPGGAQAVRRSLPASSRSAGFGLLFTGSSIGAMIAAPVAIALLRYGSWHLAFVGTAAVGLAWIPFWLVISGAPRARAALDRVDALGPTGEDAPSESWVRLIREPSVVRALILVVASAPVISFNLNWMPQYLVADRRISQLGLARYVWLPPLLFDLGAVAFGALASRRERAWAATGSDATTASHRILVAVAGLCCATLPLVPSAPGPWSAVMIASLAGAGGGGLFALLTGDMLARVSPRRVSMAGGMTAAAQSLSYVVVNPLIGWAVDRTHSYSGPFFALGALVVPGVAIWLAWPITAPRRA